MKTLLTTAVAALLIASTAAAERYVMVTHTQGTDPFWPVVEKGANDAAAALGVELEYYFAASGDMADMAKLIEAGTATNPRWPDCIIAGCSSSRQRHSRSHRCGNSRNYNKLWA